MDWLIVSRQFYFTINLEEIFYFCNKKCRIYAAYGVSQTPKSKHKYKRSQHEKNKTNSRNIISSISNWTICYNTCDGYNRPFRYTEHVKSITFCNVCNPSTNLGICINLQINEEIVKKANVSSNINYGKVIRFY